MTDYKNYTDHLLNSETPFIGALSWYSVSDSARVQHPDLIKWVEEFDAPIKVPAVAKPGDVFRRATKQAQRNKVPTGKPGTFYNFMIRDLGYDDNFVRRMLVAEQVDSKDRDVDYDKLSKITFNKINREITFEDYDERDDATLKVTSDIKDFITSFVAENSFTVAPVVIRSIIRVCLETTLNGTAVRPGGGVYFLSLDRLEELEAAYKVFTNLDGASIHYHPLVDDERQRAMVKEAFQSECEDSIRDLVSDAQDLLKLDGPVPARQFSELSNRLKATKSKLGVYSSILEGQLSKTESDLEIARAQIEKLLEKTH